MKNYAIGEVSKALDISVQAVRLYQKKGLIQPTYINEENGYRYYDESEVAKIWRIKILQSAGFELSEIKELDHLTLKEIEVVLEEKRKKLNDVISQKKLALKYLDRQLFGIDAFHQENNIQLKWIDDRYGIKFGDKPRYNLFDHLSDLSHLKGLYGINQEVSYEPTSRFVIESDEIKLLDLLAVQEEINSESTLQPGGWYVCSYVKKGKSFKRTFRRILEYIVENGYTLRGDAISVILINDNLVNHKEYNIRELQVAILKD